MSKPNPEQFAKVLLWHLAGTRADIAAIEVRLAALEERIAGKVSEETYEKWQARTKTLQAKLYLEACREAGLPTDQPPTFPTGDDRRIE